jgi:hypothetical protein
VAPLPRTCRNRRRLNDRPMSVLLPIKPAPHRTRLRYRVVNVPSVMTLLTWSIP